jgi:hypothetical protein
MRVEFGRPAFRLNPLFYFRVGRGHYLADERIEPCPRFSPFDHLSLGFHA